MVVGAVAHRTQLAVIGAGPGGYAAALRGADAGLDVTLIDAAELGGTCLNVGCIPSKALIDVATTRHRALEAAARGLRAAIDVDMMTVQSHLQTTVRSLRHGVQTLLDQAGVQVVRGIAHFAKFDRLSIEVGDQVMHLEFDDAIVATGSRPLALPNFDVTTPGVVDSTGALALKALPASMVVIGGGYIGVELGTAFAKLGSAVSIVEAKGSVLADTPPALRKAVERRLQTLGIDVRTSVTAQTRTPAGLRLSDGELLEAELIVVAVGRRPNSDRCSIEQSGATVDAAGFIAVDKRLSAAPGIWAIGDVIAGPALAHRATSDAERVVAAITGEVAIEPAVIPEVIFSDPELCSVGVGTAEARRTGLRVHRFPHAASARAVAVGEPSGLTIVITDADDTILGVHAAGPHAAELAGEAALAIELAATLDDLASTIHPHPTLSESVAEAALVGLERPLHVRR